jgi:uncharacterized membrane protein YfcA
MMKKWFLFFVLVAGGEVLQAQDRDNGEDNGGFKRENVFLGGSISLGFGSGSFGIGANPEVGYSVAQWLDAGLVFNINYLSQKYYGDPYSHDINVSNFNYGGGPFVRIFPLPFLFAQFQLEHNWTNSTTKDLVTNETAKYTVGATSLLAGIGYGQRAIGQGGFFTFIGIDLLTDPYSPYRDGYGGAIPVIRAGYDFYLRPSRKPKPESRVL